MPQPLVIPSLADATGYAETDLGTTRWVPITQARIDAFAEAAGNRHWIHTDPERAARETPWKTAVAQGYLLLSLVPGLLPELIVLGGWRTAINTSVDACRFPAPVPAGARVRMSARLGRVRSIAGGGCRLTFPVEFEVEGGSEPACQARVNYVYYP